MTNSLQHRLVWWLSSAIILVAVAAGAFSFIKAFEEANELQDDVLRQVAALVRHQGLSLPAQSLPAGDGAQTDPEAHLIIQSLTRMTYGTALPLPAGLQDGLATVELPQGVYRVLVKTLPDAERIAVSQDTKVRDEIAIDSAIRTVLPLLILLPMLVFVVFELTRKMFKPIADLSSEVDSRNELDLHPLPAQNLPGEVQPFVTAINRLLGRVDQSMGVQRRFVADAAHELRTPLTALSLQAERLAGVDMSAQARERLALLQQGIERGRRLLDQMLSLARAQESANRPNALISVRQVCKRVLEDLISLAESKSIDVGMIDGEDISVMMEELDLYSILKNLIDNAIRYTPVGGRVDLRVFKSQGHITLEVEDNGVGIPAVERERVLDPFYRVLGTGETGSGLGLAIVKSTVLKLGGQMVLTDATDHNHGLKVILTFNNATD
jgi:two-component system, OmpR family, sensor kinase